MNHAQEWEALTDEQKDTAWVRADVLVLTSVMSLLEYGMAIVGIQFGARSTWPPELKAAWSRLLAAHSDFEQQYKKAEHDMALLLP